MRRVLAVDAGNSNITIGCFEDHVLVARIRLETQRKWTPHVMRATIRKKLTEAGFWSPDPEDGKLINGCVLSSVVPTVNDMILSSLTDITGKVPQLVTTDLPTGITMEDYDGTTLGVDRYVDMAAALELYGGPFMICDFGTCSTMSVVDEHGHFKGGFITAGMQLSLDAMAERTAQLPEIELNEDVPQSTLLGKTTYGCMVKGAVAGAAAMVEGLFDRVCTEYGWADAKLVITGGLGVLARPYFRTEVIYNRELLLDGLERLWKE